MSREIKFRLWDEDIEEFLFFGIMNPISELVEDGYFSSGYIEKNAEQFTGLKDCNGVEIYEGDIVVYCENTYSNHYEKQVGVITFDSGSFVFKLNNEVYRGNQWNGGAVSDFEIRTHFDKGNYKFMKYPPEIIGNIHEKEIK